MAADWKNIGLPRWYDCKLGKMNDQRLADLVGTSKPVIRYRRQLFGITVWTAKQAIEPYRHLLAIESDRRVARLCGVSPHCVATYRRSLGLKAKPGPAPGTKVKKFPANHPLRPYKALLGLVHDRDVAKLAGVSRTTVRNWREDFGLQPAKPLPKTPAQSRIENYVGPWLGYESLFGTMSSAKISRAVGVPLQIVEQRQRFLGVAPFRRVSKVSRYQHLVGVIPNALLAKLAGVSSTRVAEFRSSCRLEGIEDNG